VERLRRNHCVVSTAVIQLQPNRFSTPNSEFIWEMVLYSGIEDLSGRVLPGRPQ
jgi:hypothetical protein